MGVKLGQKWAVKDGNLLASNQVGSRFFNKEFDFSRASNGTYIDRDGLLKTAELYNLLPYGSDFSQWTLKNVTSGHAGYDGTNNAYLQSGTLRLQQSISLNSSVYTGSIYVKAGFSNYVLFYIVGTSIAIIRFELIGDGAIVFNGGGISPKIESVGNEWYRISVSLNSDISSFRIYPQNDSGGTETADSSLYIQDAQLVEGTEPLAYQYTNGLQGLPRISFEDGVGHLLLEPQTTQLVPYSEDFTQWVTGGNTAIEGGYLAPDGTNSAYKVSGSNNALIATGLPNLFTSSTRSIYARTVSGTGQANLMTYYGNTNNLFTITDQWQRFDVNSAISTGSTGFYAVDFRGDTNISEIIIWGANATNDQTYPTSYIKTEGTSVTRLADVCNNSGSAQDFNSEEGVLYAEIARGGGANDDYELISLMDSTNTIRVGFGKKENSTDWYIRVILGSLSMNVNAGEFEEGFQKIAIKYKSGDSSVWLNGDEINTNTTAFSTTLNFSELEFDWGGNAFPFYGKVRNLQVFTEALSDEELISLTT